MNHTTLENGKNGMVFNSLGRELAIGDVVTANSARGTRQVTITAIWFVEPKTNGETLTMGNCK